MKRPPAKPFKVVIGVAAESLKDAARGDYRLLAAKLRGDADLRRDERDFLADLLEGKQTPIRPRNRPPDVSKKQEVAKFVYVCEMLRPQWGREATVAYAMEQFGVSRKYAYGALRKCPLESLKAPDGSVYLDVWSPANPLAITEAASPPK